MRIGDLTRRRGQAVVPAWPPQVWTSAGSVFTPGHLGVLKSVQRIRDREFGDWLAVVAVHEGREHHGALRCDGPPSLSELEMVLRGQIGRRIQDIGEIQA
jgi:hypothetical protein